MDSDILTCPLCGFAFDRENTLCWHGCPLGTMCNLVRCPNCEYEFPETPKSISWLQRVFKRAEPAVTRLPVNVRPVTALQPGERGEVLCLGGTNTERHNTLTVFGLMEGAEITLIQQRPSCVIRAGETELALDPEIAAGILVKRSANGKEP